MNHVQRIHMIVLQTTCHREFFLLLLLRLYPLIQHTRAHDSNKGGSLLVCAFRDASFLMMLQHFERKHFITADKLPLPPISTPVSKKIDWIWDTPSSPLPPLPPPSSPSRGRIYTYNFLVGRIRGDPTFDPKQMEEIATLERKEGTFTFLDDEAKTEEPLTIISSTRSPSRQQRRDGGGEGGGGNILIGTSHYHILNNTTNNTSSGGNNNNHGQQQQQQSTTTGGGTKAAAFYSVLREEPPIDRPKLSNPTMYRLGTPVVSRRPPPTITNFFGMKAIVVPTLQKQHQQQQQQQQN
ncbi:hypothetical protein FRC15_009520 [Serendipita sp. 397]|nr:hypothetical protein FRC15_009520 [Serendipita sp. 397]